MNVVIQMSCGGGWPRGGSRDVLSRWPGWSGKVRPGMSAATGTPVTPCWRTWRRCCRLACRSQSWPTAPVAVRPCATCWSRGWELKSYAILHCPFKDVILLDADNVPLVDPAVLLSCAEYHATGAIFWPDLGNLGRDNPIWQICRVRYRDEPAWETGQIVIDKQRCWKALHLTQHLNDRSDFYYRKGGRKPRA